METKAKAMFVVQEEEASAQKEGDGMDDGDTQVD